MGGEGPPGAPQCPARPVHPESRGQGRGTPRQGRVLRGRSYGRTRGLPGRGQASPRETGPGGLGAASYSGPDPANCRSSRWAIPGVAAGTRESPGRTQRSEHPRKGMPAPGQDEHRAWDSATPVLPLTQPPSVASPWPGVTFIRSRRPPRPPARRAHGRGPAPYMPRGAARGKGRDVVGGAANGRGARGRGAGRRAAPGSPWGRGEREGAGLGRRRSQWARRAGQRGVAWAP